VRPAQQLGQHPLALLQRLKAQVGAVDLQEIEGQELDLVVVPPRVQAVEIAPAVGPHDRALAVDRERGGGQPLGRRDNQGIAVGPA
jgi:hypothetical protein